MGVRARWRWVAWLALVSAPGVSLAGEPFQEFLDGLRRREMFDTALTYLEQAKTNPLVAEADRARIPFEEGRTLVEEAGTIRDLAVRNARLNDAQSRFESFIKANPEHPVAAEAKVQLGTVLVERGRVALATARSPRQAANKSQLIADARQRFEQAQQVFTQAEQRFKSEYEAFPKVIDPKERQQTQARNQARLNLIQAQMLSATVLQDLAKTLEPTDAQRAAQMQAAAAKYEEIYKAYNSLLVGLYARMHQAECLLEAGNPTDALTYLDEVLAQVGGKPELRKLMNKALPLALAGWNQAQEYSKTIEQSAIWQRDATGMERQSPEGLAILWRTTQAHRLRAAAQKDAPEKAKEADLRQAGILAADVARVPGEFQDEARALIAEVRKNAAPAEPKTFAEALNQGKAAVDEVNAAVEQLKQAAGNAAEAARAQAIRSDAISRAKQSLATALSLRDPEATPDALAEARYYQAYLNYLEERYYDAAILAEFVARNHPQTGMARQSARIALASWLQAYNGQPVEDRNFEVARLASIAEFIGETWSDQPEAAEAWMLLGDVSLRAGNVEQARECFARIPADSPQRLEADLKQAQALWSVYLDGQRSGKVSSEADGQLAEAQKLLEPAIERARSAGGEPSFNLLAAELTLAQIYNAQLDYAKALAVLERPETGAVALVAAKNAVVARGNFAGETLKTALRAYVGARSLDKAEQAMKQLDEQYANQPGGQSQLTAVYVGLGRELEDQVKQLQASGQKEELAAVLGGFQLFLDRISATENAAPSTLIWAGETYARLGSGVQADPAKAVQAKEYFAKSKAAYERLLKLAETDEKVRQGAPAIRLRLARAYRGAGEYAAAIAQLTTILDANPNVLEVQLEVADAYEQWGAKDPAYYQQAIHGSGTSGNLWGWNGIQRRLQAAEKYRSQYEQARYHVATCSYRLALSKQGDERARSLVSVERLIQSFARLDPELGGPEQRAKFDQLLKEVQRAQGRQPDGLLPVAPATTARSPRKPTT